MLYIEVFISFKEIKKYIYLIEGSITWIHCLTEWYRVSAVGFQREGNDFTSREPKLGGEGGTDGFVVRNDFASLRN